MDRNQLEHLISAAAAATNRDRVYVLGIQAALATVDPLPGRPYLETELGVDGPDPADPDQPTGAELITDVLGEGSTFDEHFGYCADGVSLEVPAFPDGWWERTVDLRSDSAPGVTGVCPDIHDLVLAAYERGGKYRAYAKTFIEEGLVDRATLVARSDLMSVDRLRSQGGHSMLLCRIDHDCDALAPDRPPSL